MNHFVIVLWLAVLLPVPATAALRFPWFHTRPKPVLLDQSTETAVEQHRAVWRGAAAFLLTVVSISRTRSTRARPRNAGSANGRGASREATPKRN